MSLFILEQTWDLEIIVIGTRTPELYMECKCVNITRYIEQGTDSRSFPMDVPQTMRPAAAGSSRSLKTREDDDNDRW